MKGFHRRLQHWTCSGILLFSTLTKAQQSTPSDLGQTAQPSPTASRYTLNVYSQLVLLDTVVRDQNGNAVKHLTKDDFTILEDGIAQPIAGFEAIDTTEQSAARPTVHSTEELEKVAPKSPVTILVLDELTTRFEDEYFARYSLNKYLGAQNDTLSEPTLLLARTYNRTLVLHDYTTSRKEILDALERHLVTNDWRAKDPSQSETLFGAAFASLIEVAKATQGHAGHKNLVWIGRGFPSIDPTTLTPDHADALKNAIVSCSTLLREARITLYSLDPSGVATGFESTADANGNLTPNDPFGGQVDFDTMVESTGGIAMHGRNDVERMIGEAVLDGEVFYTLAYRPSASADKDPKKFHQIKVVMKNPQWVAISREGYYAPVQQTGSESQADGDISAARDLDLAGAINGLMVYGGIPLEIVRKDQTDAYAVTFPAASIGLEEKDDKLSGEVDLIVVDFDRNGRMVGSSGKVLSLHLPPLEAEKADTRKITVTTSAGDTSHAARIRFVVRSHSNAAVGAENYFLADRNSLRDPATGLKPAKP